MPVPSPQKGREYATTIPTSTSTSSDRTTTTTTPKNSSFIDPQTVERVRVTNVYSLEKKGII